jgi:hypothetical protein
LLDNQLNSNDRGTAMSVRLPLVLSLALLASRPALAQDAQALIGASDCRLAAVKPAPAQPPTWSGGCKEGYAEGKGVLEWHTEEGKAYRLSATLHGGVVQGEGELRYPGGGEYTGTLKDGVPEGNGYYRDAKGSQYQGEIHAGYFDGPGEVLYYTGDTYTGQLKDDKPNGVGKMTYILGGSYEGNWKDGKPRSTPACRRAKPSRSTDSTPKSAISSPARATRSRKTTRAPAVRFRWMSRAPSPSPRPWAMRS